MRRMIRNVGFPALLLLTASCAEMCAPEDVAMGVSRLTTLNADALTNALNLDKTCGFDSDLVKMGAKFDATKVGTVTTLTLTVKDCVIDFGTAGGTTSTNCLDKSTRAFGKATVSGTKTITGYLTGNPASMMIPEGPDSVEIALDATFDNFKAEKDGGTATMTWISGGITGKLRPRLGVAAANGACAIQTTNTAFSDVVYKPSKVLLKSADTELELDIQKSNLSGMFGVGPTGENTITGTMGVYDNEYAIPVEGVTDGLDPDYKADTFIEGFACKEGLAAPLSYTCDLKPVLAQSAARGLVKLIGVATGLVEANNTCGFSSAPVGGAMTRQGAPGGAGSITFTTTAAPCAITFADETTLSPDCTGSTTVASGKVTIDSTKVIAGYLTNEAATPVVPMSRQAASYDHKSLVFENFKAFDKSAAGVAGPSFTFTGTIAAKVKPVAGEHKTDTNPVTNNGPLYKVPTPVLAFEGIATATGTLTLVSGGNRFVITLADVALDAQNGSFGGKSNSISGSLTVNGTAFAALPDPRLNPDFTQAAFDGSYSCNPALKAPVPAE